VSSKPKRLRLNLCCGESRKEGFVGVDIDPNPAVDMVVDLNILPWPWDDNSVDEVFVTDGLEHLSPLGKAEGQANIVAVMREIGRILKPGGQFEIMVPSTDSRGAWQDPTHVTYWNKNTFLYFASNYAFQGSFGKYSYGYPKFEMERLETIDGDLMTQWVHVIGRK